MKRVLLSLTAVAVLTLPAIATASYKQTYHRLYQQDREQNGVQSPGCHLLSDRFDNRCKGKFTREDVLDSIRTLRNHVRVIQPAPAPVAAKASYAAPSASTSAYTAPSTAGGPEAYVACESGGDWGAVNPSSGAYGRYQIMPMHWNGGMCSDLGQDPSGQTACANRIYETQGSGAWSQCGG